MENYNLILTSLMIAIIAFVYSDVLTEPKMILNPLYLELEKILPEQIFKPIIGCFKCVAGQMALWSYIFIFDYNFIMHVFFICLTIYLSKIVCKIYRYKEV